ncbi:MAG: AAA family ATPase, partial [Acidimicrobiia bacterium]|nr:AAA family ATPase [Acidimicrobiia bacterium]
MLDHLRVRNLGLIREAVIEPSGGLTVLSGETGAGKTVLLGALRLLMGETADASLVGPFGEAAQSDAVIVSDGEVGLTRVVPAEGRSRAYIDGAIASADA